MKKYLIIVLLLVFAFPSAVNAQKVGLKTNALYWATTTPNLGLEVGMGDRFSFYLEGGYNPWTFKENQQPKEHMQNRQLTFAVGARYYPWHVYTGWWASAGAQYTKYNTGGIIRTRTWEGEVYGVTLGAGYSWLLTRSLNLDFGLGLMVGPNHFRTYSCPACGRIEEMDKKEIYVGPNELIVKLSYLF